MESGIKVSAGALNALSWMVSADSREYPLPLLPTLDMIVQEPLNSLQLSMHDQEIYIYVGVIALFCPRSFFIIMKF